MIRIKIKICNHEFVVKPKTLQRSTINLALIYGYIKQVIILIIPYLMNFS